MNKLSMPMVVLVMAGFFVAGPVLAAQSDRSSTDHSSTNMQSGQNSSMSHGQNANEMHAFKASFLMDKTVKDQKGETLGKVEDLVVGQDGRINFVVISHGGALGAGTKYTPIPFKTFMSEPNNMARMNTDNDLVAKIDKGRFDAGPSFDNKSWDPASSDWQNKVVSYYGAESSHGSESSQGR